MAYLHYASASTTPPPNDDDDDDQRGDYDDDDDDDDDAEGWSSMRTKPTFNSVQHRGISRLVMKSIQI